MNWEKKNSPFACVRRGQELKFQKVRELLFGPKPVPEKLPCKKHKNRKPFWARPIEERKKTSYHWSYTYEIDDYGYTKKTKVKRVHWPWLKKREVKKVERPKTAFSSAHAFGQALRCRGYEHLGHGAFSTVYAKPGSDRVIKVTHRPDHWIDYCLWGEKNGYAGTLSPKVYSYKMFTKGERFSVSVVERMKKTCSRMGRKEDLYILDDLLGKYIHSENTMCGLFLEELSPGLAAFGLKLKENFGGLDLHGGNIMVRENGTVCVTDPITYMDDESLAGTYTRLKAKDFTSLAKAIAFINKLRYIQWYENLHRHRS